MALYPYESGEPGDLTFAAGDIIKVTKADGDWWTGKCGEREGVFPNNYVQKYQTDKVSPPPDSKPQIFS